MQHASQDHACWLSQFKPRAENLLIGEHGARIRQVPLGRHDAFAAIDKQHLRMPHGHGVTVDVGHHRVRLDGPRGLVGGQPERAGTWRAQRDVGRPEPTSTNCLTPLARHVGDGARQELLILKGQVGDIGRLALTASAASRSTSKLSLPPSQ